MSSREEFEAYSEDHEFLSVCPIGRSKTSGKYQDFDLQCAWETWHAAIEMMQPKWHPMSELPPFPFRGDICSDGEVIINADWAGDYWQTPKGDRSADLVSHWKPSNKTISLPDGIKP